MKKSKLLIVVLIGLLLAVGLGQLACSLGVDCEGSCGMIYSQPGGGNCSGVNGGSGDSCDGTKSGCICKK